MGQGGGGPAGDEHYNLVATHVPPKAACLETTNHDYSRADGFTAMAYEAKVFDSYNQTMHDVSYPLRVGLGSGNGSHGMGDNANVSPSIKIGSGLGIPSPPAVAFNWQEGPGGTLGMSDADTGGSPPVRVHQTLAVAEQSVVRRLTPVECCRLQGFPDDWNSEGIDKTGKRIQMADAPRYRQFGNAVTVNVANWIANNLAAVYAAPKESADGEP